MKLEEFIDPSVIKPIIMPVINTPGLVVYEINRDKLENLVRESELVKKYASSFYDYDLHALKRIQHDRDFLITALREIDRDGEIRFIGKEFDKDRRLMGNNILFIIKELEHLTCLRFAYAAYQLMLENLRTYKILQRIPTTVSPLSINFNNNTLKKVEDYFNERLAKYIYGKK